MHAMELGWIEQLQLLRTPALDVFFLCLRFFDRPEFAFLLISLIWIHRGWKNGVRLFYIVFFNALFNAILKYVFASPRPFELSPHLGVIHAGGYGFPSGAAQISMLLAGLLVTIWKNPIKWVIVIPYVFFVSLSRVYLGVHFPSDIVGGWIAGLGMLYFVLHFMPRIEKRLNSLQVYQLLSLHLLVIIGLSVLFSIYGAAYFVGWSIGLAGGLWLCQRYRVELVFSRSAKQYFWRSVVGGFGVFLSYLIAPGFFVLEAIFASLWISFFSPLLFQKNTIK